MVKVGREVKELKMVVSEEQVIEVAGRSELQFFIFGSLNNIHI